jgi:CheY-like chemotaxis protein
MATIVVVDDNDQVRRAVVRLLERTGYVVVAADSAHAALSIIGTLPTVDLIISDVQMPAINGRQLGERIRAIRPDVPVLYVSGGHHDMALDVAVAEGKARLLAKPMTTRELLDTVATMLAASDAATAG